MNFKISFKKVISSEVAKLSLTVNKNKWGAVFLFSYHQKFKSFFCKEPSFFKKKSLVIDKCFSISFPVNSEAFFPSDNSLAISFLKTLTPTLS